MPEALICALALEITGKVSPIDDELARLLAEGGCYRRRSSQRIPGRNTLRWRNYELVLGNIMEITLWRTGQKADY